MKKTITITIDKAPFEELKEICKNSGSKISSVLDLQIKRLVKLNKESSE